MRAVPLPTTMLQLLVCCAAFVGLVTVAASDAAESSLGLCDSSKTLATAYGYGPIDAEEVQRDVSIVIKHVSEFRARLLTDVLSSSACAHPS